MILDKYVIEIRNYKAANLKKLRADTAKSGDLVLPSNFNQFTFATKPETWSWATPSADAIVQTLGGKHIDTFGFGIAKISITGSTGMKTRMVNSKMRFLNGYEQVMALYKIYEKSKHVNKEGNRFETVFYNFKAGKAWYINIDNFQMAMSVQKNHQYVYTIEMTILGDYNQNLYSIFGVLGRAYSALDEWIKFVNGIQGYLDVIRGTAEIANDMVFAFDRTLQKTCQPILDAGDMAVDIARTMDKFIGFAPTLFLAAPLQRFLDKITEAKRVILQIPEDSRASFSNVLKRMWRTANLMVKNEMITHKRNPAVVALNEVDMTAIREAIAGSDYDDGIFNLTPLQQQGLLAGSGYTVEQEIEFESGMSLEKLAEELYNDTSKWTLIYETNKDVIGDDPQNIPLGTKIKVLTKPEQDELVNDLVDYLDVFDIWEQDKIYGTGLYFDGEDVGWDYNTNSFKTVSGLDNLIQVLKIRMQHRVGDLVRYSQYGNYALNQLGSSGSVENKQVLAIEIEKTLRAEPRVKDVREVKIIHSDDKIYAEAEILPIFKEEYQTIKQELIK